MFFNKTVVALVMCASLEHATSFSVPGRSFRGGLASSKAAKNDEVTRRDAAFALGTLFTILERAESAHGAMAASPAVGDLAVCAASFRTPSYSAWREKEIQPNIMNGKLTVLPKNVNVVRQIFAKSTNPSGEEGKDTVHSITILPMKDLPAMAQYFDKSGEFFSRGQSDGWLLAPVDCNFFKSEAFLNARKLGAPGPIEKGSAFAYGGHGIAVPFSEWKEAFESPESIAFLEGFGISGVSYGQSIPKYSNVIKGNGVGIIDFFPTYADARRFTDTLLSEGKTYSGMTFAQGPKFFKKPFYLTAAQVTDDFVY